MLSENRDTIYVASRIYSLFALSLINFYKFDHIFHEIKYLVSVFKSVET